MEVKSPLTQGRELKLLLPFTDYNGQRVAPHAGA